MQDVTAEVDPNLPLAEGLVRAYVGLGYDARAETQTTADGRERTVIRVQPVDGGGDPADYTALVVPFGAIPRVMTSEEILFMFDATRLHGAPD